MSDIDKKVRQIREIADVISMTYRDMDRAKVDVSTLSTEVKDYKDKLKLKEDALAKHRTLVISYEESIKALEVEMLEALEIKKGVMVEESHIDLESREEPIATSEPKPCMPRELGEVVKEIVRIAGMGQ